MPQRECTKVQMNGTSPQQRNTLPIETERYNEIGDDCHIYRQWLAEMIVNYPALFPENIRAEYLLHDDRSSPKLEHVRLRRICLETRDSKGQKHVFTIAPSGIMPYFVDRPMKLQKPCSCVALMYLLGL